MEHENKPPKFWQKVLFTDEKRNELVNSKRRIYCWGKKVWNEPSSLTDLEEAAREVWNELKPQTLQNLIDRLPFLCKAVIEAEGGYFDEKYAPRKFKKQQVY